MNGSVFFDTTILIYAISQGDPRALVAEGLLASGGHLSVQVLNEFAAVARRKLGMTWPEIVEALDAFRALCKAPTPLTLETHTKAIHLAARFGYNFYDSLILAAALQARCQTLYSEDMRHGQRIDSITILNPFAAAGQ